ncbi:MAG TPA: translation initiation factor IF-2 subunit alpha [Candidatus Norongarragalinales archaeon]|nr:translation initiation factor IF-2 subunit alpha [Candidatus Norongarragalinales archaeon]
MDAYPEVGEYAVGRVRKILPFGAIIALDEYGNREAFVHVSEVSSGWVRNIREHAREDQVVVVKIISIDPTKHQVDASLKRVSDSDKKRKLQSIQRQKRAVKMLEASAQKLGKSITVAVTEVQKPLEEAYGDLFSAFETISLGTCTVKLPKAWQPVIEELVKREIRPKVFHVRAAMTLKCYTTNGIEKIKKILAKVGEPVEGAKINILYVSAPTYYVDVESSSYKAAEKVVASLGEKLVKNAPAPEFESGIAVKAEAS